MGRLIRFREFRQYTRYYTRHLKIQMAEKRLGKIPVTRMPALLKEKYGIEVVDPVSPNFPRPPQQARVGGGDGVELESQSLFNSRPCLTHDGSKPLAEGVKHAAYLIKAVMRDGLPEVVSDSVKHLDLDAMRERIFRLIMQSQQWDSTLEKLPKRRDPVLWWRSWPRAFGIPLVRKNQILMDNLVRESLMMSTDFPGVRELRTFRNGAVNALVDRNQTLLRLTSVASVALSTERNPLRPILDDGQVSQTENETLQSIYPIGPFIDLRPETVYDDASIYPLMWTETPSLPRTLLLNKDVNLAYPWTGTESAASAVMSAFALASSFATRKYATPDSSSTRLRQRLPEPVTVQCVQVCGGVLDFVVLQLNTLDLNGDSGIKNAVWVDAANTLFSSPPFHEDFKQVNDYNPQVLRKFFGIVLNGMER